ncbi:acyltransferase family protein [Aeromonas enteropelogenes]|uniref:acyltransferase family protein n=1 Tax=Aeromonas enteropelogenes TaxID=29489 RepID=UPI003F797B49
MKRNEYLDYLKGILISLVVLGHSIQVSRINFDDNFLFRVIYSFHMPFFFLVSGYLAFSQLKKKGISVFSFKRKVVMLLIPFIGWYLIYNIDVIYSSSGQPIHVIFQYLLALFRGVDLGLWYLWILLLMYVIIFFRSK